MKKTSIFLLAALALAGCAKNERLGGEAPAMLGDGSIGFSFLKPAATRADLVGSSAASALNNNFVVYGTKHLTAAEDGTAANDVVVFDQYHVQYVANTAGTAASNTHNWDYVGKISYNDAVTSQEIKYWDYSAANGYTFYAFSSNNITYPAASADLVSVSKTLTGTTKYDKGYQVTVKDGASLDNMYYSDRAEVAKSAYGKHVTLTFRNFGSRVRVGFYETVPGYTVHIDKFYFDDDATLVVTDFANMTDASTTNFKASLENVTTPAAGNTFTITYNDNTVPAVENQVKVTNSTVTYAHTLSLGTGITAATALAETAANPTWDNSGNYTTVFPIEANANPMLIKVDYTLKANTGTGSTETIVVKNARVLVPAQFCQWKSNTAYTYLFKISPNTNGTTGVVGADPEGLYPITFDAVVVEATEDKQETISTFATNTVTTYATYSDILTNNEYKKDSALYVVNSLSTGTHAVIAPSAIGVAATEAQVYKVTTSGSEAIDEATVLAKLNDMPNKLTLTPVSATLEQYVPASDGTKYDFGAKGAVKFTPDAVGTYAYVYCNTAYVATTYSSASSLTYSSTATYFLKTSSDVYYQASGINAENFETNKANLYVVNTAGTAGVYDVKVIKVQ